MNDLNISWKDDPLWYKDAIIYQLHVKAFFDSNNDGCGDFAGLTQKLDYIKELGVNVLWLMPFYPSPLRDDGYDISDFVNINPDFGSIKDFKLFIREAHKRELKVITELVINHTSDQHPWFQAARNSPPNSHQRDYYVWSDTPLKFAGTRIIFTDTEISNWNWDPVAKAYYWHRFFSHQPDLNHNNPKVVKAVCRVLRFWLDMGVDGMRLDAVPYLCVREGTNNENLPETHAVLKELRAVLDAEYKGRMFLAEANQWPEDVRDYFGDGDECHMAYNFPLMPRIYMAVAQEDRHPITDIMHQIPKIPENCQWAIFLRNHDELTLEMVTHKERDYMYKIYSTDPRMRINVGIRRRLAPLMENNTEKIKLLNSLLLSMPGTPIIYYGDEIGMGDNVFLGDRNGVRTPMQWSPDRNGGFSRADPQRLYSPLIMDPVYGFEAVNVESQSRDTSSLLNWMKDMIAVRKSYKVFGRGTIEFLRPGNRRILAYFRHYNGETILCVANLSRNSQPVELNLSAYKSRVPVELLGSTSFPPIGELPYLLTLHGYGFYWFRLSAEAERPSWHEERLPLHDLPVLVLSEGWRSLLPKKFALAHIAMENDFCHHLTSEVFPVFFPVQRWFAGKSEKPKAFEIIRLVEWADGSETWFLLWVQVSFTNATEQIYFLPLCIVWESADTEKRVRDLLPQTLSKVRQRANTGILCDGLGDPSFCMTLIRNMYAGAELVLSGGTLKFYSSSYLKDIIDKGFEGLNIQLSTCGSSNTAVILDNRLFLKGYRRLTKGVNVEAEMGKYLTETCSFPHIVPLAGVVEFIADDDSLYTLAVLHGYAHNQGNVWDYTLKYLEMFLVDCLAKAELPAAEIKTEMHEGFLMMMKKLGQRTGELHLALSRTTGNPSFDPEPITDKDILSWKETVTADAVRTLDMLEKEKERLSTSLQNTIGFLLNMRPQLMEQIIGLGFEGIQASKIRHHGDYHLGQVLLHHNDFVIIDFEGEPSRPIEERRAKHSPIRDVAGMQRSFSYAAYHVLFNLALNKPNALVILEPFALDWFHQTCDAFFNTYIKTMRGSLSLPKNPPHVEALLNLFILEKVLYEIRYELSNRPDWLEVPVKGLIRVILGKTVKMDTTNLNQL